MNITELARQLRVSTQELHDLLPQLGFDIGQRAIKVDDRLAQRIATSWNRMIREHRERERVAKEEAKKDEIRTINQASQGEVKIGPTITVRELSTKLNLPLTTLIQALMKSGILASQNERIDFETATIMAEDLGFKVIQETEDQLNTEKAILTSDRLKNLLEETDKSKLKTRPPVVVVMGHVDHGKTKLLDAIRKTHIMEGEAGGITQHIGAYQVEKKGQLITFIDTPGHEAFTVMRSRGARVADIAILVIAADDGIKPQTKEAISIIQAAKIPFIVAINKIDKPEANIEKVKQELASADLLPEDWGGKVICVPISAKMGEGIASLLEMILLVADMDKDKIVANPDKLAAGTVIESHLDKNEGAVATVLVQGGTLKVGDYLAINNVLYGKVRAMKNFKNDDYKVALPSMPVKIIGFKNAPQVGDIVEAVADCNIKALEKKIKFVSMQRGEVKKKEGPSEEEGGEKAKKYYNVIIRADVLGSLEAIVDSLERIVHPEVGVKVIGKGLGNVNESDLASAEASKATIIGFNVNALPAIQEIARNKKIEIKKYSIIYKLIEEVKEILNTMLGSEKVRVDLGRIKVVQIFKTGKKDMIVGGKIIEGRMEFDVKHGQVNLDITRNKEKIGQGIMAQLQAGKENVREVVAGQECGILYQGKPIIEEGDILEAYREEDKIKKLE